MIRNLGTEEGLQGEGPARKVRLFQGEGLLAALGILGFVLAAVCVVWMLLYGGEVAPNGDVSKAASFNAALGIFLLSTAAVLPLSAMSTRGKAIFRWSYAILSMYSYFAENVQNMRGMNPRFAEGGTAFDIAVAAGFGLVAMLLIVFYCVLAVAFFRSRSYKLRPELVLAIRYAMVAILLSFAAGIWISLTESRMTGENGNIMWLHGLGFHAIQAIPLVAWLSERTRLRPQERRKWVHVAGTAYILGLLEVGWQTWNGGAMLEWSPLPLLALFFFLLSFGAGCFMFWQSVTGRKRSEVSSPSLGSEG
ncbi:hypothetical protein SAMN04487969_1118 [Paenibacillus algorifonticola]|uniref:Uncharacterized protein n=1 Tax=Paenibacillus algorifonticola TaxID=684063 RepID=A0A1I2F4F3_9BACL|nr:hypothetical protein [Paenibacillus algorifonticola]SFE99879.1 hypothetical protein SAMN04487969_1118 [Paenibacillus algorifonticola]